MKRVVTAFLTTLIVATIGLADETTFHHVWLATAKGKQVKAVLTFSDQAKAIEVHPAKSTAISIPYGQIDKCDYEYTNALMGDRNYWLKVDYHDQDAHKVLLLLMDKRNYIQILDALKAHTGIDAEIVGNAKKR